MIAQPVFACMQAIKQETVAAFDAAIQACVNAGLVHLTSLMNELCGIMLLEGNARTSTKRWECAAGSQDGGYCQ